MAKIFGLDFRTKEEKAKIYEEYSKRIFPFGEPQKEQIAELLNELFPKYNQAYLLMYYIMLKEHMTENEPLEYEEAAAKVKKRKAVVRVTPELEKVVRLILEADLLMDENLTYMTADQIREQI